jgi:hypothetical protein
MFRQRKAMVILSAAVAACVVGALIWLGGADAGVPLAIGSDPDELPTLAPLVEKIGPGVVYIEIRSRVEQQKYPILKSNLREFPRSRTTRSLKVLSASQF